MTEQRIYLHDDYELQIRIRSEFVEMPGLTLTLPQAARLFNLQPDHCERILDDLVDTGTLRTNGRAFMRADSGRRML
jgi:hypothetical protein